MSQSLHLFSCSVGLWYCCFHHSRPARAVKVWLFWCVFSIQPCWVLFPKLVTETHKKRVQLRITPLLSDLIWSSDNCMLLQLWDKGRGKDKLRLTRECNLREFICWYLYAYGNQTNATMPLSLALATVIRTELLFKISMLWCVTIGSTGYLTLP